MRISSLAVATALTFFGALGGTMSAHAGLVTPDAAFFTPINTQSAGGSERCLWGGTTGAITSATTDQCAAGGSFGGRNSILQDIANGFGTGVSLTRVKDKPVSNGGPNGSDNIFTFNGAPTSSVMARARYAGNQNDVGYFDGGHQATSNPANFVKLFTITTNNTDTLSGPSVEINSVTGEFRLAIKFGSSYTYLTDQADSLNGGKDHAVTWRINGLHPNEEARGIFSYIVGFEDLNLGDQDYNDVVVQLDFSAVTVPEPASIVLLGAALLGLGALRRRVGR